MTREEYHRQERNYKKYGWLLVIKVLVIFGVLAIVINHLNK